MSKRRNKGYRVGSCLIQHKVDDDIVLINGCEVNTSFDHVKEILMGGGNIRDTEGRIHDPHNPHDSCVDISMRI